MKIFIDSADIDEIREIESYGILDGVTTNPSLIKKALEKREGKKTDIEKYIKEILKTCKGLPVSLEVTGTSYDEMIKEARNIYKKFNKVEKNVYVKIPVNPCMKSDCDSLPEGLKAIKTLTEEGIPINCTLIFTPEQALLAAKAGAKFVSPFAGRIDDYIREENKINFEKGDYFPKEGMEKRGKLLHDEGILSGIDLVKKTIEIFRKSNIKSEVLAASIRSKRQLREAAEAGSDIVTVPYKVIKESLNHEKTVQGMKKFVKDTVKEYSDITHEK